MFSVVFLIALVLSASVATEHGVATLSSGVHPDTLYRGASTSTIAGAADHVGAGNDTTIFETFGEVRCCHCFFACVLYSCHESQHAVNSLSIYIMRCGKFAFQSSLPVSDSHHVVLHHLLFLRYIFARAHHWT